MSAINVNSITGRTGSHGPVLTGVTTISGDLHVGSGLSVTGVSTFSNTVVGGATTELVVGGDARITGILTIGTGSITIDGTSGSSSITGVSTVGITSVYLDSINNLNYPTAGPLSNRNLIINGAQVIQQRGNPSTGHNVFATDRFRVFNDDSSSSFTVSNSSDAPVGFQNSAKVVVSSAVTPSGSAGALFRYQVEGYDAAQLDLGTASAKTFTLSFWVKSTLTGTFAGSFNNGDFNRYYVYEYTINAANTWEHKTVTITGDTTGTWNKTNGDGMRIYWDLGSGSNFEQTAGSWNAGEGLRTSGSIDFCQNASAEFYLTGVQLELGSRATPFEHRSYADELARCQRYCYRLDGNDLAYVCNLAPYTSDVAIGTIVFPVTMRAAPSQIITTGTASDYGVVMSSTVADCTAIPAINNGSQNSSGINFYSTGNMAGAGNGRFSADNVYLVFHGASEL